MPSTSTVQAPHTPCSQPACAPVRPRWSRRQSSNVVRGSMSSACCAPLTVSSMRMWFSLGFSLRMSVCISDRARGKCGRHTAPVVGRSMQISEWLDVSKRRAHGLVHFGIVEGRAKQLLLSAFEPERTIGNGADANGDTFCLAVVAQLHLHRCRNECEIATPRIHLVKADADFAWPDQESAHRSGMRRREGQWSSVRRRIPVRGYPQSFCPCDRPTSRRASPRSMTALPPDRHWRATRRRCRAHV